MNYLRGLIARRADLVTSLFFAGIGAFVTWLICAIVSIGGAAAWPIAVALGTIATVFYVLAVFWAITERRPVGPDRTQLMFVWSRD